MPLTTSVVYVDDALDVLELGTFDLAVVSDPGIVEDDVDPAVMGDDGLGIVETASRSATLRICVCTSPPASVISLSVTASPSEFTPEMASFAPRRESLTARSRPIPEPAPVTTTTLSRKSFMSAFFRVVGVFQAPTPAVGAEVSCAGTVLAAWLMS